MIWTEPEIKIIFAHLHLRDHRKIQVMAAKEGAIRCQRIGCDAMFALTDNPEDSCTYHPGVTNFFPFPFSSSLLGYELSEGSMDFGRFLN